MKNKAVASPRRSQDPVERKLWWMQHTFERRKKQIAKIRADAEKEISAIQAKDAQLRVLYDAIKRGSLKP